VVFLGRNVALFGFYIIFKLVHQISYRYENLLDLGRQRRQKLEEYHKAYQLVREAGELAHWITEKVICYLSMIIKKLIISLV